MAEDQIEAIRDGLVRLQSAAEGFARDEVGRISGAVIDDLRTRPASHIFGDVAARHLWDDYCWSLQEGPFDDDMGWDEVRLGSLSGALDDMVRAVAQAEIEKLPRHALVFLSANAVEQDGDGDQDEAHGGIWIDGIMSLVLEEVNTRASRRRLDLIGPNRGDAIGYEVEGSGMVWSVLSDRGEAMELIASHCDALIDPDGDLSDLAEEMVEAFMTAASEDGEGKAFAVFLDRFEGEVRALVKDKDVMPSLEDIRAGLLDRLDG